ncbi:MAG: hypothetical protein J07HN4v3_02789 [Halonotius sp. J07HN4]|nr:MAG: hypothetical protein J07HN4v3_02789 [Halonotius sp. J07HN4]
MPRFSYPCPGCRTTNSLHEPDCRFEGTPWPTIEKAYIDCLAVLTAEELTEETLRNAVDSEWSDLHTAALATLKSLNRIDQADDGTLRLLTAAEYAEQVSEPSIEPMATIYEHGSVPGCHDNAVFAMIAWYEMVDLSWPETKDNVVTWLRESGAWIAAALRNPRRRSLSKTNATSTRPATAGNRPVKRPKLSSTVISDSAAVLTYAVARNQISS